MSEQEGVAVQIVGTAKLLLQPLIVIRREREPEVTQLLMARGRMTPLKPLKPRFPLSMNVGTPRAGIDEDLAIRQDWFPCPEAYMNQLTGIFMWEAFSRLDQIKVPTVVIHGDADRLVPPGNGRLIAARIPNAKLILIPHASHIFSTDHRALRRLCSRGHFRRLQPHTDFQ